jgi:hypothetical protein
MCGNGGKNNKIYNVVQQSSGNSIFGNSYGNANNVVRYMPQISESFGAFGGMSNGCYNNMTGCDDALRVTLSDGTSFNALRK